MNIFALFILTLFIFGTTDRLEKVVQIIAFGVDQKT